MPRPTFPLWRQVVKVKEVYMDYLRNQGRAKALLETLRKDNRVFLEFVEVRCDAYGGAG